MSLAGHFCTANAATAVQLRGFDNLDTLRCHLQLSTIYHNYKDYVGAINHLLAGKYLIALLGGSQHPEMTSVFARLGSLLCEIGCVEIGLKCLEEAKSRSIVNNEKIRTCDINIDIAEILCNFKRFGDAAAYQTKAYRMLKQLLGNEHAKVVNVKKVLEYYLRFDLEQKNAEKRYYEEERKRSAVEQAEAKKLEEQQRQTNAINKLIADDAASKKKNKSTNSINKKAKK